MRLSVGDICTSWFIDKAVGGVMRAFIVAGRRREAIFRSLDAVLCVLV
jgi:hypothetical protein